MYALISNISYAAGTSPNDWPSSSRYIAEQRQWSGWKATVSRSISGSKGIVSATASPIAVESGIQCLKKGANAADAAATIALTQVATELGSVISYAGILSLVYYDSKTRRAYSLNAGYDSYLHETQPETIPVCDLGALDATDRTGLDGGGTTMPLPTVTKDKGRETLVPGFMAGIEELHRRFGSKPFAELFQPAIYYAEHGVVINSPLEHYFSSRKKYLARTAEGRAFIAQAGNEQPKRGDRFFQLELAKTLRAVATHGANYMYTGLWGRHFVELVRREGGKVVRADLANYRATWSEPLHVEYLGNDVYTSGFPNQAAYHILTGLNLAEQLKLDEQDSYWRDPASLLRLQQIGDITESAPLLTPSLRATLRNRGVKFSPKDQLTKAYAKELIRELDNLPTATRMAPNHSNAIVVVDEAGNIAAMTHTINSVPWGDTGIVVDGIPLPDSAGFQQSRLASIKPGAHLPNELTQTIALKNGRPIFATAAIGSSMIPETLKTIVGVVGRRTSLDELQAAPPVMHNFALMPGQGLSKPKGILIPEGCYSEAFTRSLNQQTSNVSSIPKAVAAGLRGTVAAVSIDSLTNSKSAAETADLLLFGDAY